MPLKIWRLRGAFKYKSMPSGVYKHKKGYKRLPFSEKWKENLSKAKIGKKRKSFTKKAKENMSKGRIGMKFSDKHKDNLKKHHKGMLGKKHRKHFKIIMSKKLKGRKFSPKWKEKLSKSHRGEKCHFWKGGISKNPYPVNWREILKESIRQRDNHVCQLCNKRQKNEALSVHHIDYNKKNLNPNNLISLCRNCHRKTNNSREYWIKFFRRKKYEE